MVAQSVTHVAVYIMNLPYFFILKRSVADHCPQPQEEDGHRHDHQPEFGRPLDPFTVGDRRQPKRN